MKTHLAIFDLDGTLFDTAPANHAAYAQALRPFGVDLPYDYFRLHMNGRYYKDFLPELIGGDPAKLEAVHRAKKAAYPQYLHKIRENTALFTLLTTMSETYHIALVTTAARESVLAILDHFSRRPLFELILAQEDIPRKKPAPDGFLAAMEYFGVSPDDTIVFEDSPEGIAAARDCGAAYLVVDQIAAASGLPAKPPAGRRM